MTVTNSQLLQDEVAIMWRSELGHEFGLEIEFNIIFK